MMHYGQGKWYPGEPLPRWALSCYWRKDGLPLWRDRGLLARRIRRPNSDRTRRNALLKCSRAGSSGPRVREARVRGSGPLPRRERNCRSMSMWPTIGSKMPATVNASGKRIRAWLEDPGGYVLPIQRGDGADGPEWQSGSGYCESSISIWCPVTPRWVCACPCRACHGLRPTKLRRLSRPIRWPSAVRSPSRTHALRSIRRCRFARDRSRDRMPGIGESASWVVRTALCIEPRDGRLHVFMPPVALADDYLELLAAIEDTAAHLSMPVVIEGYTPPHDYRIRHFSVTPDPGVIEVNIHPAHNWAELVANTTAIYEEARLCRLGTEKFMVDGRHTGTGGGNHFALGAFTPADSPFLRRPDLFRSMIAYWLNHPSLIVHVLGDVHRADQPGPAYRRDAQGQPLRTRNCV